MSYETALSQMIAQTEKRLNRKLQVEEITILRNALEKSLCRINEAV